MKPLTVAQLIEELQRLPSYALVVMPLAADGISRPVLGAEVFKDGYFHENRVRILVE